MLIKQTLSQTEYSLYYLISSVIWQNDWLPERARWHYLARLGLPAMSFKKNIRAVEACNKSFIDQVCLVKMAEYWPHPFLLVYGARLRLGPQKMNLADILLS